MKSLYYRACKRCLLLLVAAIMITGCNGGRIGSPELTYDESISPEQELELMHKQAKEFADSISREGYNILGIVVNEELNDVYYAKAGLHVVESRATFLPPIIKRNIKTCEEQTVSIPASIDGHPVGATLIVQAWREGDKILMLLSNEQDLLNNHHTMPIDVVLFDAKNEAFSYVTGGKPWRIGEEHQSNGQDIPLLRYVYLYGSTPRIPLSQIFDGSFSFDNMTFNEKDVDSDVDYDEYEEIEDNGYTQPTSSSSNSVSNKSDTKPIKTEANTKPSDQVSTAPEAPVREEKQTAPQAEQKAKANAGPEFQGGNYALTSYIAKHIHYPPVAAEKKIQGKVIVKVTISATGQVSNAEIVQSADAMLDAEALRLAKSLPRFTPARRNGQPVQSTMTIPINFRL